MAEATVPSSDSGRGLTRHDVSGPSWLASLGFPPADVVGIGPFVQLRLRRGERKVGDISLREGGGRASLQKAFPLLATSNRGADPLLIGGMVLMQRLP